MYAACVSPLFSVFRVVEALKNPLENIVRAMLRKEG